MRPTLKPKRYPRLDHYEPIVDFRKLKEFAAALLPEKRADQFAFDLMEIDWACNSFRSSTTRFFKALRRAKRDSTDLWDTTSEVAGSVEEFRKHGRRVLRVLDALDTIARTMPPLDKATDLQLTERALAPFDEILAKQELTRSSARKKKTKKISAKKKTNKRSTKKTSKRKKK